MDYSKAYKPRYSHAGKKLGGSATWRTHPGSKRLKAPPSPQLLVPTERPSPTSWAAANEAESRVRFGSSFELPVAFLV